MISSCFEVTLNDTPPFIQSRSLGGVTSRELILSADGAWDKVVRI